MERYIAARTDSNTAIRRIYEVYGISHILKEMAVHKVNWAILCCAGNDGRDVQHRRCRQMYYIACYSLKYKILKIVTCKTYCILFICSIINSQQAFYYY